MRLALVTYALQVGGVESFLRMLAGHCRGAGHVVDIVETSTHGRARQDFIRGGLVVIDAVARPWETRLHHVRRLGPLLGAYDAIVLNDAPFAQAALGLIGERSAAVPVLHLPVASMVRTATACAREWDVLVTVSPAGSETAARDGVDPLRMLCIPNGVEVPELKRGSARQGEAAGPLRAIFIGRIEHCQKGVLHLPGIVRRARELGAGLRLDVVGDGPDLPALRALTAEQCPGSVVSFHGALGHEAAMELLSTAQVLVMPSAFEGLPIVLLEAMAHGVVPVVSRLPGSTDYVVTQGRDGLLIGPADEEGFAQAIATVAADRRLLGRLSFAARETVCRRFTAQAVAVRYLETLQRCADVRKAGGAPVRSGRIALGLLGDYPGLPVSFVRPARKLARLVGTR